MSFFWIHIKKIFFLQSIGLQGSEGFNIIDTNDNNYLQLSDFGRISHEQKNRLQELFNTIGVDIAKLSSNTGYPRKLIEDRISDNFLRKYQEILNSSSNLRKRTIRPEGNSNPTDKQGVNTGRLIYSPRNREKSMAMQKMLSSQGYYTMNIDGIFGIGSKKALQRFLQDQGLYSGGIDGIIGKQSLLAMRLFNAGRGGTTRKTRKAQVRERIEDNREQILSEYKIKRAASWMRRSYSQEQINTIAGIFAGRQNTLEDIVIATSLFQAKNGLVVDGIPGRMTIRKLGVIFTESNQAQEVPKNNFNINSNIENINNIEQKNLEFMRKYIPRSWHSRFQIFLTSLSTGEQLHPNYPIIICDSLRGKALHVIGSKHTETSVYYGIEGFQNNSVSQFSRTPRRVIFYFNDAIIPVNPLGNASRNNVDGVIGASLISPQGEKGRGKWFHGLPNNAVATYGCVGFKDINIIRAMALQVRSSGKGYGYVV